MGGGEYTYKNLTAPQEALGGRQIPLVTGRGLGGSGSVNVMWWFQGHPADYDGWRDAGATGWGWDDMLPYLRRSEHSELGPSDFHGAGGPMVITPPRDVHPAMMAFVAACAEQGLTLSDDLNGAERDGVGTPQTNIRDGTRYGVVEGYLRPALTRKNLTVRVGVQVKRLLIDGERVVGVRLPEAEIRARRGSNLGRRCAANAATADGVGHRAASPVARTRYRRRPRSTGRGGQTCTTTPGWSSPGR